MGKCKFCGWELDVLVFSANVVNFGTFNGEEFQTKNYGDWSDEEYSCPDCAKTLATDEKTARKLLKGGIK